MIFNTVIYGGGGEGGNVVDTFASESLKNATANTKVVLNDVSTAWSSPFIVSPESTTTNITYHNSSYNGGMVFVCGGHISKDFLVAVNREATRSYDYEAWAHSNYYSFNPATKTYTNFANFSADNDLQQNLISFGCDEYNVGLRQVHNNSLPQYRPVVINGYGSSEIITSAYTAPGLISYIPGYILCANSIYDFKTQTSYTGLGFNLSTTYTDYVWLLKDDADALYEFDYTSYVWHLRKLVNGAFVEQPLTGWVTRGTPTDNMRNHIFTVDSKGKFKVVMQSEGNSGYRHLGILKVDLNAKTIDYSLKSEFLDLLTDTDDNFIFVRAFDRGAYGEIFVQTYAFDRYCKMARFKLDYTTEQLTRLPDVFADLPDGYVTSAAVNKLDELCTVTLTTRNIYVEQRSSHVIVYNLPVKTYVRSLTNVAPYQFYSTTPARNTFTETSLTGYIVENKGEDSLGNTVLSVATVLDPTADPWTPTNKVFGFNANVTEGVQ